MRVTTVHIDVSSMIGDVGQQLVIAACVFWAGVVGLLGFAAVISGRRKTALWMSVFSIVSGIVCTMWAIFSTSATKLPLLFCSAPIVIGILIVFSMHWQRRRADQASG